MAVITKFHSTPTYEFWPLSHARILHDNLIAVGRGTAITTSATATGTSSEALRYPTTYEKWKAAGSLENHIRLDFATSSYVSGVCIVGHNFSDADVEFDILVKYEESGTQRFKITREDLNYKLSGNEPIFVILEPSIALHDLEWIEIQTRQTNGVQIEIAHLIVGRSFGMERPIFTGVNPATLNRQITLRTPTSISGQALGFSVQRVGAQATYNWTNITPKFMFGEQMTNFRNHAEFGTGFFAIAWRPSLQPVSSGLAYPGGPEAFTSSPTVQFGAFAKGSKSSITGKPDCLNFSFTMESAGAVK